MCGYTIGGSTFFDILEENKKRKERATEAVRVSGGKSSRMVAKGYAVKKVNKGTRGMPRLSEAMKDVISCDKLRGLANTN